jgi:MEDS: MEthanogen/methylotroph, DcmR Sensory domain
VWAISDPITEEDAKRVLRREIPDFDQRLAHGRMERVQGNEWYLKGDQFDLRRITSGWSEKLSGVLARGYKGMRVSGNAFWFESKHRFHSPAQFRIQTLNRVCCADDPPHSAGKGEEGNDFTPGPRICGRASLNGIDRDLRKG